MSLDKFFSLVKRQFVPPIKAMSVA